MDVAVGAIHPDLEPERVLVEITRPRRVCDCVHREGHLLEHHLSPLAKARSASLPFHRSVALSELASCSASSRAAARSFGLFLPPIARSAQFAAFLTKLRLSDASRS